MKKINIKGPIVSNDDAWIYELFEIEHTSPKMIDEKIEELNGDQAIIEINSGGGSVFAGSEIYTKLMKLNCNVEIVGLAGSAASVIAMAGKKVSISPTAQIMIHNASTIAQGNKEEFDATSIFLDSIDSGIASAYQAKTKLPIEEIKGMMTRETWFNAQSAVEKGLADEVMFAEVDAVASVGVVLPENVINKVRNVMKKEPNNDNERFANIEKNLEALTNKMNKEELTNKPVKDNWLF